jgi:hypothetical protein
VCLFDKARPQNTSMAEALLAETIRRSAPIMQVSHASNPATAALLLSRPTSNGILADYSTSDAEISCDTERPSDRLRSEGKMNCVPQRISKGCAERREKCSKVLSDLDEPRARSRAKVI